MNKRRGLSLNDLIDGVKNCDRTVLGRAITLMESRSAEHQKDARDLLDKIMPLSGNSIRIGVTGVPGAGKSTLIETLGLYLVERDHRVAVLAVDPSSSLTGGSILGDKTRMEKLSRHPNCFIRPSPTGGMHGGVTNKTRESIFLLEAAGFDVILIETVGVGQNEIAVRSMVDFFLLIQIAGAGDELQGIKKGVIEIADAILINKADGDNEVKAEAAKKDFAMALHYLRPATEGWQTTIDTCSALTGAGIDRLWQTVTEFRELTAKNGLFKLRRRQQTKNWLHAIVEERLRQNFFKNNQVKKMLRKIEDDVIAGKMPANTAAEALLQAYAQN